MLLTFKGMYTAGAATPTCRSVLFLCMVVYARPALYFAFTRLTCMCTDCCPTVHLFDCNCGASAHMWHSLKWRRGVLGMLSFKYRPFPPPLIDLSE